MNVKKLVFYVPIFLLILYLGFDFLAKQSIDTISISELEDRLQEDQSDSVIFIDVRENHEYESSHIEGMKNYPLSTLKSQYSDIPINSEVIIICRSGKRSLQAAKLLKDKGYTNIKSVDGGILQWTGELVSYK
ncbi:rhodanese-related sulfurtransferase [Bacillus mesophilus]|uniref:Rhodanese-like domain-containing protein n=1 Tax=Bacillus mesophilus TaxID=1808955 RepID=A0A6M0QBV4_9BACI|nr:rhodanese-like domain-containing protein [Bacillus mesophilus]MBM7660182.1 rhodanese-related sulfurtransferase [Bacillus mesophilus]NEY73833.1 rhodanese-like domain-containing protein [Bacillus mesophilus]